MKFFIINVPFKSGISVAFVNKNLTKMYLIINSADGLRGISEVHRRCVFASATLIGDICCFLNTKSNPL